MAVVAGGTWLLHHFWSRLRDKVAQGFAVFDPPTRYVRTVVVSLADWALRFTTIWFFLGAFGIPQSVEHAVLVQATMSLATLVPATPGGIGTEQALLVYAFRDVGVARSTLLAFSVGMKLTITVVNVVVGFLAIFLTLGTLRYRSVVSAAAAGVGGRAEVAPRSSPPATTASGATRRPRRRSRAPPRVAPGRSTPGRARARPRASARGTTMLRPGRSRGRNAPRTPCTRSRCGRASGQRLHAHVLARQVVPRRQPGLEEDPRVVRTGDLLAVDAHDDRLEEFSTSIRW